MEHVRTDLIVMKKAEVEAIVESSQTKWIRTLRWQTVKTVDSKFEGTLKANCFNSIINFKTGMFKVVEQLHRKVI